MAARARKGTKRVKDAALVILVTLGGLAVVAMAVFAGGDRSLLVAPPDATTESFVRELFLGQAHRCLEAIRFRDERRPTGGRESIIPAALVVEIGVGPPIRFGDEARIFQAADRGVESARPEPESTVGLAFDGLEDRVTVAVPAREGQKELRGGRG